MINKYKMLGVFITLIFVILTGCGTSNKTTTISGTENNDVELDVSANKNYEIATTADGVRYFEATVKKITSDTMLVIPSDEYIEAKSYEKISVSNWFSHEVKVGDVITIYYDGIVMEISPPLLNEIYGMSTVDENDEFIEVYVDEKQTKIEDDENSVSDDYEIEITDDKMLN